MSDKTFTQADLDKVTADAEARITAMDKKVSEALTEAKAAKAEMRKLKEIDPADLTRLEDENEKLRAELTGAQKQAKDSAAALEKATKALESESSFTHRLLAENGVVEALTANGVTDAAYISAAKALHLPNVKITADGDTRAALYGDKPLADAIKEWAAGEIGQKFVSAPASGGGGAQGSKQAPAGKSMTTEAFMKLAAPARAAAMEEGLTLTD